MRFKPLDKMPALKAREKVGRKFHELRSGFGRSPRDFISRCHGNGHTPSVICGVCGRCGGKGAAQ